MSDEVKATNFGCCDRVGVGGCGSDWLEWLILLFIIFWLFGGSNWFGRGGCCR